MESKLKILSILLIHYSISNHLVLAQSFITNDKKANIELITVSAIEITQIKTSKKITKPKKFTKNQINEFINAWNNTKENAICPTKYNFQITIDFQDYTRRLFFLDNSIITENKIHCYNLNNHSLIEKLWKQ